MSGNPQFLKEYAAASFESAKVAILPVPYGETVSYVRGTEKGPAAIIETGFMNLDRQFLTTQPEVAAQGIVAGIICYLDNESISPTPTPAQ